MKQEVCSRDDVMHVGKNGLWFSTRSWLEGEQEWQQRKCEYNEEVGERLGYAVRYNQLNLWQAFMQKIQFKRIIIVHRQIHNRVSKQWPSYLLLTHWWLTKQYPNACHWTYQTLTSSIERRQLQLSICLVCMAVEIIHNFRRRPDRFIGAQSVVQYVSHRDCSLGLITIQRCKTTSKLTQPTVQRRSDVLALCPCFISSVVILSAPTAKKTFSTRLPIIW